MNSTVHPAELRRARRNQMFDNVASSVGQCPLKSREVAIFPVRYALDESPDKGTSQGPNPLPEGWDSQLPPLKTRSYTLRQLRDGWLYVWDDTDTTFHEYEVKGYHLIRHTWTDAQLNKDVRHNPGEAKPYVIYPRRNRLRMAYSPVQWTWRICERMRSDAARQQRWMREVDLSAFCRTYRLAHGAPLVELGASVADILVRDMPQPDFVTTYYPTQATPDNRPFKETIEECLVRGRVPDQHTALFVALDDPLAMIADLNMNLEGRRSEQVAFETRDEPRLHSAQSVHRLCGLDVESLTPKSVKGLRPRQAYADDLYSLMDAYDEAERTARMVAGAESALTDWATVPELTAAKAAFHTTWGHVPDEAAWQAATQAWQAKRQWRNDVHFDDVRAYLRQHNTEAQRLQAHYRHSEHDLLTWVQRLEASAEEVYHDSGHSDQSTALLSTVYQLYNALSHDEAGQAWLREEALEPRTLVGMAPFNFNLELAQLIRTVSDNFASTGYLDGDTRRRDGSHVVFDLEESADATNLASRVNELSAVLDFDTLRRSEPYREMSDTAHRALLTLRETVNDSTGLASKAWYGIGTLMMPSFRQHVPLTLCIAHLLTSIDISYRLQLIYHLDHAQRMAVWKRREKVLVKQITAQKQQLSRPNPGHDQRAIRLALLDLEARLQALHFERPQRITARSLDSSGRLESYNLEHGKVPDWLEDLGRGQALEHHLLKGQKGNAHSESLNNWMKQDMGPALPVLVAALNVWNLQDSFRKASNDGLYTAEEQVMVAMNAAYTANAVMTLWMGPMWNQAGKMVGTVKDQTLSVAKAGYLNWVAEARHAKAVGDTAKAVGDTAKAAAAEEFAVFSRTLIFRTVTWAVFGVLAAGLEVLQIDGDLENATSDEERVALTVKKWIVTLMGAGSAAFVLGGIVGIGGSFAWIMSTPVMIALLVVGVAYLLISIVANSYKREELRLWLYRCNWGRNPEAEWKAKDGHLKQMAALMILLQRPTVVGRSAQAATGGYSLKWQGVWLQILLPQTLSGHEVEVQAVIVNARHRDHRAEERGKRALVEQLKLGRWVAPSAFSTFPLGQDRPPILGDHPYDAADPHRLWQVWIPADQPAPIIEIEIKYPKDMPSLVGGRGYMFRLALTSVAENADLENTAFDKKTRSDLVLVKNNQQWVKLTVPN